MDALITLIVQLIYVSLHLF
ncbi:Nodule Cysteine-Rich (NCR) secreted peptide [Medicago truncatula]|uniref:Nodule Cysteine-Rich (NCR) secreted peptide n=1 Tax=Medicago truncatula TaxID=3880 RepID=A0A072V6V6_MEDTR|nr:Nodule Cysteine-Rich (NCR) secreted peptide [Medicago truncatula]